MQQWLFLKCYSFEYFSLCSPFDLGWDRTEANVHLQITLPLQRVKKTTLAALPAALEGVPNPHLVLQQTKCHSSKNKVMKQNEDLNIKCTWWVCLTFEIYIFQLTMFFCFLFFFNDLDTKGWFWSIITIIFIVSMIKIFFFVIFKHISWCTNSS